jgi:hypothetical protein
MIMRASPPLVGKKYSGLENWSPLSIARYDVDVGYVFGFPAPFKYAAREIGVSCTFPS